MIDNPRSPRVRGVAKLAKKDHRADTGRFLVEGPQAVAEAFAHRPELVLEVYGTPSALERFPELRRAAQAAGSELEYVTEQVLDAMADTVTPQGIVAVCRQFPVGLREVFAAGTRLVAILEEVRDPGNAGTIIRAADAAGADAVVLSGRTVDLYNPKVVRSTTGSLFHLPVAVGAELAEVVERAHAAGVRVIAADTRGSDLLQQRRAGLLDRPTAWLFGNEARGLDESRRALADAVVTVPIYGAAESMNLATAASVCLYESAFAQHA
ncbi:MAG: RNA methyltransferase [Microbacteriaceae bacterium]